MVFAAIPKHNTERAHLSIQTNYTMLANIIALFYSQVNVVTESKATLNIV